MSQTQTPDLNAILAAPDEPQMDRRERAKRKTAELLTPATLKKIRLWRCEQLSQPQVAEKLGISSGWLSQLKRKHPKLREALDGFSQDVVESEKDQKSRPLVPARLGTAESLELIQKYVREGVSMKSVAVMFDVSVDEFQVYMDEHPGIQRAIDRGMAEAEVLAAEQLYKSLADRHDRRHLDALKFTLSARFGWSAPVAAKRIEREEAAAKTPTRPAEPSADEIFDLLGDNGSAQSVAARLGGGK